MTQPYIGEIRLFSWNFAPRNWAFCNGQILSIAQNQALFALLGTMYGGNGVSNFALPNLQSATPIHFGNGFAQGEPTGVEQVTVTLSTMASHTHTMFGANVNADKKAGGGNLFANDTAANTNFFAPAGNLTPLNPQEISPSGGNQPHSNMQPYLVMNYCIALYGIFPSRN